MRWSIVWSILLCAAAHAQPLGQQLGPDGQTYWPPQLCENASHPALVYCDSSSAAVPNQGTAATGVSPPSGATGIIGWLSALFNWLSTSGATASNQSTAIGSLGTIASAQGAAGTGLTPPTGGSGSLGFLSGIYSKLSGTLTASLTGALPAGTNSIGSVTTVAPTASASDCSATLTTAGTAYQVIASATSRKTFLLQNLSSSANAGFSLTSTSPVIGSIGTFTLLPMGSYQLPIGMITSGAVWAVGAAASQPLACTLYQ